MLSGPTEWPAEKSRSREPVTPRMLRRLGDANALADGNGGLFRAAMELERRAVERAAIMGLRDPERLAEPARPRAQEPRVLDLAPLPHLFEARHRLERADQHGARAAFRLAHEVEAPVDAVGAV